MYTQIAHTFYPLFTYAHAKTHTIFLLSLSLCTHFLCLHNKILTSHTIFNLTPSLSLTNVWFPWYTHYSYLYSLSLSLSLSVLHVHTHTQTLDDTPYLSHIIPLSLSLFHTHTHTHTHTHKHSASLSLILWILTPFISSLSQTHTHSLSLFLSLSQDPPHPIFFTHNQRRSGRNLRL